MSQIKSIQRSGPQTTDLDTADFLQKYSPSTAIQETTKQLTLLGEHIKEQLTRIDHWRLECASLAEVRAILVEMHSVSKGRLDQKQESLDQQQDRVNDLQLLAAQAYNKPSVTDVANILAPLLQTAQAEALSTAKTVKMLAQNHAGVNSMEHRASVSTSHVKTVVETMLTDLFELDKAASSVSQIIRATKPQSESRNHTNTIEIGQLRQAEPHLLTPSQPIFTGVDICARWQKDYDEKLDTMFHEAQEFVELCENEESLKEQRKYKYMKQICSMLAPGRQFAQVATPSESPEIQTDADVLVVTEQEALFLLRQGPASKILLIRGAGNYCDAWENFVGRLKHRHKVDIQDIWTDENTIAKSLDSCVVAKDLADMRNPPITRDSKALNLLNLDVDISKYGMASHILTLEANLSLATNIDQRLDREFMDRTTGLISVGKKTQSAKALRDTSINSCLRFMIAGQRGVFSGPHLDILNGTYVKCLSGLKVWSILNNLSLEEEANLSEFGDQWEFSDGRARLIMLAPGDTILMPAGVKVVHAPLTLEDCVMVGGMVWDYRTILSTLKNILHLAQHPQETNEGIPTQLPEFLKMLQRLVAEQPEDFRSEENGPNFEAVLAEVIVELKMACSCFHKGKNCKEYCTCKDFKAKRSCKHVCGCRTAFQTHQCEVWCAERKDLG